MDNKTFWQLIEETRGETQPALIEQRLTLCQPDEIAEFDRIFRDYHHDSYHMPLWDAVYAVIGFCSDDSFDYFRAWLIGQGEGIYTEVTRYPQRAGEFVMKGGPWQSEALMYAALNAYQQKTGERLEWRSEQ
jgi:hypothetical protein